ncbi:MAG: hemerythrin domain-containing protein [Bacteroidota bacterium]
MKPTDELIKEHHAILLSLEVLETMCGRIEAGEECNANDVARLLDFLKTFADGCHHQKEERHLFPAMEGAGVPRDRGPIGIMLSEHDLGRKHIRGMGESLAAWQAGRPEGARELVRDARAYINLLRAHIMKENTVLFPMADRFLSPETQQTIAAAFAALEEEEIGENVHEQYHELLHELHDTYLES